MGRSIALVLALLAGALIAWSELRLPAPAAASAPATAFSANRALADVRLIAREPHPMGSAANHRVRDALLDRMAGLGLSPRLRRDDVLMRLGGDTFHGGRTETLVGVLPGRDRNAQALTLMAHYDSVPGAPGAGDDAAGVAAGLEVVRAIRARGVPSRDVVLILTDGEEAGLLGARGLFADDPLAKRIGFVLNMEARGSGGRVQMFETGRDNGGAVTLFRHAVRRPSAGSLFGEVYARLPNDTDFTLARRAGLAGLNYAFAGRAFDYHSPTDSLAHLQPGAVQDMGDQVLSVAHRVAFAERLPERSPDMVFGVLFGDLMLAYPPIWGWALLAAVAALLALAARRAARIEPLAWREVARGAAAGLYALVGAAAVLHLAGAAAGGGPLGAVRLLAAIGRWEAAQLVLAIGFGLFAAAEAARGRRLPAALLAVCTGIGSCIAAGALDAAGLAEGLAAALLALAMGGQPMSRQGAWAGVLALGLLAATAAQAIAPQAAYVLAWPLLLGALAAAATSLSADRKPGRTPLLTLLAALVLAWAGVHAHLIVVVTGLPELLTLPLFMAALAAWPLAHPTAGAPPERVAGRLLLAAGAAIVVLLRVADPWDARHPQPSFAAYQLDQDAGNAWRIAYPDLRSAWSDATLQVDGGAVAPFRHWAWGQRMDAAPAPSITLPEPTIKTTRRPDGLLDLTVSPPAGTRVLTLRLQPTAPLQLVQAGAVRLDAPLPAGGDTGFNWTAPPAEGLTLVLRPRGQGSLRLRYVLEFDHWPAGITPPALPPAAVMATGRSGATLVTGSRRVTW